MNEAENIDELLRCAGAMALPQHRAATARALAEFLGAEDLIVFVRDSAVGHSLPAPGFPQTLRDGKNWRELVSRGMAEGSAEATVTTAEGERPALAVGLPDGTVAVLLGGNPHQSRVEKLRSMLPLFGALFRMEGISQRSEAESTMARQSAAQAGALAAKLDAARAELQRALAVAETATRARDEFLATVSHELRTPLTSMIGWIQLLRGEKDPAWLPEGLETIERNAKAQGRLIEDILDFSRINAGKLRLEVRPIALIDVIVASIEVIRPGADAKGVTLETTLDPGAGVVSGDPDRLQQVIWNLLSNAVKFTRRGGRVEIRLARVNSYCQLTVSDTGEGIDPGFLPHVFDRFSQADSTSTRTHGGLGLGLGIVRHLVELHGGAVQAMSPGLGKGATFSVRLPLVAAQYGGKGDVLLADSALQTSKHRFQPTDLDGVSVLVVEDNDDARKMITMILQRSGASVESADGVATALELIGNHRPDIVISDIEMPGEDGYSLLRKIRLQEAASDHVPAIALTAYTQGDDRVRALSAGFQMHMAKPVEAAELVAAVKSLLTTSRHSAKRPPAVDVS